MNRLIASRLHLAGALLTLLMLVLLASSCSKDGAPVAPDRLGSGSTRGTGGLSGGYSSGLDDIPSEAVITMGPGKSLTDFLTANNLELVSTLDVPATGAFASQTYYLVHHVEDKAIDPTKFNPGDLTSYSRHNRVWMPEDDRGGLSFDDDHVWRTGGDYSSQYAISKVKIPQARMLTEGAGEIIAILDTGVDQAHPLFTTGKARFSYDKNYTVFPPITGVTESSRNGTDEDEDGYPDDGVGHGTHVAGIVYTGARQATLRIYKVLDGEGRGTSFGLAKAVKAATEYGVHVINLSLGLAADDPMLHHVLEHAASQNIAIVASAGNVGTNAIQYPAAYDVVFSVTSTDNQDVRASFANYGPTVDITAPGVNIISPIPSTFGSGKYAIASGSSMAAPWVSAAIALTHARWSAYVTARGAGNHVMSVTDDINPMNPGYAGQLGSGRVNYDNALTMFYPILIEE